MSNYFLLIKEWHKWTYKLRISQIRYLEKDKHKLKPKVLDKS